MAHVALGPRMVIITMDNFSELMRAEIRDRVGALREALVAWPSPDAAPEDPADAAAAFEIAANAGLLHRYTGEPDPIEHLAGWPAETRRALALDAARAIDTTAAIALLDALAEIDEPGEADLHRVEQALLRRDVLGVASDTLERVCADMLPGGEAPDLAVGDALGQVWLRLDALDQAFERAGPITQAAMPILDGLKEGIVAHAELPPWWLEDGPAQLAAEEDAFTRLLFPSGRHAFACARDIVDDLLKKLPPAKAAVPGMTLAGACGGETVERSLRGPESPLYFRLAHEGTGYGCQVYDRNGQPPAHIDGLHLVLLSDEGELAAWPFDADGHAHVPAFPAGPARRLVVRRADGVEVGEVALDD